MGAAAPSLALGIEEEYLLVDPVSGDLVPKQDPAFMPDCRARLGEQVTNKLLKGEVEVGNRICQNVSEARSELHHLRRTVAEVAAQLGMAIVACSTHPSALWAEQRNTEKERYEELTEKYQVLAR